MNNNKKNVKPQKKSRALVAKINKREYTMLSIVDVHGLKQPNGLRGKTRNKASDLLFNVSPSTVATITALTTIAQGVALSNRTGDTVFLERGSTLITMNSFNSDVFTTVRIIIFQWHPNDALAVPTAADILQNSVSHVMSFLDWNFSNQYTILMDKAFALSGGVTSPTSSTNIYWSQEFGFENLQKRIEFQLTSTFGSNKIYCLAMSDSAIAPFPNVSLNFRTVFSEDQF